MDLAASVLFYLHSTLCLAFGFFVLRRLSALAPAGMETLADWRDLEGLEEGFVHTSGWVILGLYLLFTEIYLYRMHLGL